MKQPARPAKQTTCVQTCLGRYRDVPDDLAPYTSD
jgi:hypothetical protein